MLPSLTGGGDTAAASGAAAGATDPTAAAAATGGTADAAAAGSAMGGGGLGSLASSARWLGPVMAIGGGVAALTAFAKGHDGSKFRKIGGIGGAVGGLGLTAIGFKAKGVETGATATAAEAQAAMESMNSAYTANIQQVTDAATEQIGALQEQIATGGGEAAATSEAVGEQPVPGATTATGAASADAQAAAAMGETQLADGTTMSAASGLDDPAWSESVTVPSSGVPVAGTPSEALIGRSVTLQAGTTAGGTPIADAGTYVIEQPGGDPNGYATLEEANAAARTSMSTELSGSKYLRWMVVEHDGRFYGAIAKQASPQATATPLSSDVGEVVSWSAMNHVEDGGTTGWQAYEWSKSGGARAFAVPYESTSVFPAGATPTASTTTSPTSAAPTGTAPAGAIGGGPASAASTTPAAPATGAAFDPSSELGRTFAVNEATTAEGDPAGGGTVQVQRLAAGSEAGFATPEEAATAARSARAASPDASKWDRWVTLQGSDGKHYVYEASIVARPTQELQTAAPLHVFGAGFAEYFDGATSSWSAVRDAA